VIKERAYLKGRVIPRWPPISENGVTFKEEEVLLVVLPSFFIVTSHSLCKVGVGIEPNESLKKGGSFWHAGGWGAGFFFKGESGL